MKPYFKLSRPNAKNQTSIYIQGYINSVKFTIPLDGIKISPRDWHQKRQRADHKVKNIITKQQKDKLINDALEAARDWVNGKYLEYIKSSVQTSAKEFKEFVTIGDEMCANDGEMRVYDFFTNELLPNKRVGKKKLPISDKTRKSYVVSLKKVSAFYDLFKKNIHEDIRTRQQLNKIIGRKPYVELNEELDHHITLNNFNDKTLMKKFFLWLERFDYAINIFANNHKIITAVLKYAYDCDFLKYRPASYSKLEERKDPVFLNDDEYNKILNVSDLCPDQEIARAWCVILLNSGFRTGDVWELRNHHLNELEETIVKPMNKNGQLIGKTVKAPCFHRDIKEIIKKYEGFPPIKGLKTKLINQIKEVCKLAGVTTLVPVIEYDGNQMVEKLVPKYELMGIHALRRSFATRYYQHGWASLQDLMVILGHEDLETTRIYVGAQEAKALDNIKKNMVAAGVV